jgi:dipeptidyl aminopeptidase/acylaminoacyl peptidase
MNRQSRLCLPLRFTTTIVFILALLSSAAAQRGMQPADTLRVATVGDTQIAPDGERIVYAVSAVEGNETNTRLWQVRRVLRGSDPTRIIEPPRELLPAGWTGANPRWSPDGRRIAFLSTREGQTGLYVVSGAGGLPRLVVPVPETNFFITYADEPFVWSADSRRIAYISASEPDTSVPVAANERPAKPDPLVVDRIQYKSRTSFSDRLRTHVWLVDVDEANPPRQLTSGQTYDHALTFNPRGDEIAFLSNHEPDPEAVNNSDIFVVTTDGRVRQITNTRGCEYQPAWSPDGKWLAYTATKRDVTTIDSVAEDAHVWLIAADGSAQGRELTDKFDRRAQHPRWSFDSRKIYFLANDTGRTLIYWVGLNGGEVRSIFDPVALKPRPGISYAHADLLAPEYGVQIGSFSLQRSAVLDTFAFTMSTPLMPAEVWTFRADVLSGVGSPPVRVSAHNLLLTRSLALAEPEEFWFKSFDDTRIQAWLMKPTGWRDNNHYPLILSVHGGPHGMYGYGFNANFQAYAARGYAVLYINPRGSNGYGQKFSDGTLNEWGGGDYRDLMAGVDEVLRTHQWIDPSRLGVTGGSYGGFMTNWIITQTPRFRAAVASASVSNLISFYATSVYQDLVHAEFGGAPWDDYDLLWRWSPLRYVRQVQTPTMFIHGEQDNDVHITQAEEMYMALRRRGIDTVFVRYPREGHGLREPRHRQDALERTLAWFDKYLR